MPLLLGLVRRKAAYQAAGQWLTRLGLADKGGRRTGEPGGKAQRVAVALCLPSGRGSCSPTSQPDPSTC